MPTDMGGRRDVDPAVIASANRHSLLRDWARLQRVPADHQRILLLVLQSSPSPDEVGQALRAIRLPGQERTVVHKGYMVRTWAMT